MNWKRRAKIMAASIALAVAVLAIAAKLTLDRALDPESIETHLDASLRNATGNLYRVQVGSIQADPVQRRIHATGLEIAPDSVELAARRHRGQAPQIQFRCIASSATLEGISVGALLRGALVTASATIDSFRFDVELDRTASRPDSNAPARVPHEALASLSRTLHVGRIGLTDGAVHYLERAADGARPGTMRFEALSGSIRNLTNDKARMSETPCELDLEFLLAGSGRTTLWIDYDLAAPRLTLRYGGAVGHMDARALNELLVDLEGLRITDGTLDSTWFAFAVKDEEATGEAVVRYHGLDFDLLDKKTHGRGLSERLQTFVTNTFHIEHANPANPGKPATVITVRNRRPPETGFVKFLWVNLRTGVYQTLGIEKGDDDG